MLLVHLEILISQCHDNTMIRLLKSCLAIICMVWTIQIA